MGLLAMVQLGRAATPADPVKLGERFVQDLASGAFATCVKGFDATMTQAMSEATLAETWRSLQGQVGVFRSLGEPKLIRQGTHAIVVVPVTFEKATLLTKVVYDPAGKVSGLFFASAENSAAPQPPPGREKSGEFLERAVEVGAENWKLPGLLALPLAKGKHPAVVLVHGSGPHDADETVGGVKPFRDLAQGLAVRGVVALRYEKRSKSHGQRMVKLPFTVNDEVVDDAVAAAAYLRTLAEVDPKRVFVLGHSLGGSLLPRIGKRDTALSGLISLAGNTRALEDMVVEQTRHVVSHIGMPPEAQVKAIADAEELVKAVRDPDLGKKDAHALVFGSPPAYWLDLRGYRPAEQARTLPQRMLILQGERDYQVTLKEDFQGWKDALGGRKDVTFKTYPKLNHLMVAGEGVSMPAEYARPGRVEVEVVHDIARWVLGK